MSNNIAPLKMIRSKGNAYHVLLALAVTYAALLFLVPPSQHTLQKYHISAFELRLIDVTIIIPYLLIWLAGFYGYVKLKRYTFNIRHAKDGAHIDRLANGVFMLVLWPPLSSILATLTAAIVLKFPGAKDALATLGQYFNLLLPLAGFMLVASGARGLNRVAKIQPSARGVNVIAFLLAGLGAVYSNLVYLAYHNSPTAYHMPYWLVVLTLVIPYTYMWFLGLIATYEIHIYRQKVHGIVYRQSWNMLGIGVGAIIVMQIFVQYANTFASELQKLALTQYLMFIYLVLILLSVGYIFVARGADRLQKIEEV